MPALASFDPFAVDADDLYETYRDLRDRAPAYRDPGDRFWALSRFEDVRAASRDWETFSNAEGVDLDELGQRVFGPGDFLDADPPEHDELRAIVKARFTPKAIAELEPIVETAVAGLLRSAINRGAFDAIEGLAWPLPVAIMCSLLGCEADREELGRLYGEVMRRFPGEPGLPSPAVEAAADMRERFLTIARARRREPRDDVITQIAVGEIDGERLPDRKVVGMCFVLFSAGIDTVAGLIGNALLLLAEHPGQREVVLGDRSRLPAAIEEALRYESPLQFNARTTTREIEMGGHTIPAGERVLLLYGAANRDERRFDEPDRFDVSREPKRHLAFGEGIHFCIGAPLARLQTRVAVNALLSHMPNFEVAGPVERSPIYNMRSLRALPLTAAAARSRGCPHGPGGRSS